MVKMKVTAIITTYNREILYLIRALSSIISQTYKVDEIIVVDDNPFLSSNEKKLSPISESIKNEISKYENVIYLKNPNGNSGSNYSRNLGIKNCKGDFVAFLDDDDIWLPDKIEKQIAIFEKDVDNQIGMVFCSGIDRYINEDKVVEKDYYTYNLFVQSPSFKDLIRQDYIGSTSQPLIRKSVFDNVGMFDINMPARQDYEMWIRISKYYKIVGLHEKLFVYIHHNEGQITKNKVKAFQAYNLIYYKYLSEYKNDFIAWLTIQRNISINQKGLIGVIKSIVIRIIRFIVFKFKKLDI